MSRVRWENVARLAGVLAVAFLIAFGVPGGCGREPETIPLDGLPGEPVESASLPPPPAVAAPRPAAPRPPRDPRRRRPRPPRRRDTALGRGAPGRVAAGRSAVSPHMRSGERERPVYVPQVAREFSFDR